MLLPAVIKQPLRVQVCVGDRVRGLLTGDGDLLEGDSMNRVPFVCIDSTPHCSRILGGLLRSHVSTLRSTVENSSSRKLLPSFSMEVICRANRFLIRSATNCSSVRQDFVSFSSVSSAASRSRTRILVVDRCQYAGDLNRIDRAPMLIVVDGLEAVRLVHIFDVHRPPS